MVSRWIYVASLLVLYWYFLNSFVTITRVQNQRTVWCVSRCRLCRARRNFGPLRYGRLQYRGALRPRASLASKKCHVTQTHTQYGDIQPSANLRCTVKTTLGRRPETVLPRTAVLETVEGQWVTAVHRGGWPDPGGEAIITQQWPTQVRRAYASISVCVYTRIILYRNERTVLIEDGVFSVREK